MRKLTIAASAILTFAVAHTATAQDISGSRIVSGNWSGGAFTNDQGQFTHCAVSTRYRSGTLMVLSVNANATLTVGFANESWSLSEGRTYDATISIDDYRDFHVTGEAISDDMARVTFTDPNRIFRLIREGYNMDVLTSKTRLSFSLDGTHAALEKARQCALRYTQRRTQDTNPFGSARNTTQKNIESASYISRDRMVAIMANVLSRSKIRQYQFVSKEEAPESLSNEQVVWRGDNMIGTATGARLPKDMSMQDVSSRIVASDASVCSGDFASGITASTDNSGSRRVFTECRAEQPENSYRIYYSLIRDGEVVFKFSTITYQPDDGQGDQGQKLDRGLFQNAKAVVSGQ